MTENPFLPSSCHLRPLSYHRPLNHHPQGLGEPAALAHWQVAPQRSPLYAKTSHTKYPERESGPHRCLIRLGLCRPRRIVSLHIQNDAEAARLCSKDRVTHNHGHADADRRANLRHRLEEHARDALLMRVRHLGDEHRISREREVDTESDETRRGEEERTEWRSLVHHGEQEVCAAGHEGTARRRGEERAGRQRRIGR